MNENSSKSFKKIKDIQEDIVNIDSKNKSKSILFHIVFNNDREDEMNCYLTDFDNLSLKFTQKIEKCLNELNKLKIELRYIADIVKRIEKFNSDIDIDQTLKEEKFEIYKNQFFYELDNFNSQYSGKLQDIIKLLYKERHEDLEEFFKK